MCVKWWTGSCRRLIGAVRDDHSPTRRCMRKSMVASNTISAWRSTIRYQTNALRKSKPGCRRSGVGYAAVPCRNRKASSRREREEVSRSRGHYCDFQHNRELFQHKCEKSITNDKARLFWIVFRKELFSTLNISPTSGSVALSVIGREVLPVRSLIIVE